MNKLNCLIVDDEELARRLIDSYCDRLPFLEVVGQANNPIEAMDLLHRLPVDLLFLDIQMPEMKGTDMLRIIRQPPSVILTTAYTQYALEGYDLNIIDYLVKPIPFDRFVKAVGKVRDRFARPIDPTTAATLPGTAAPYAQIHAASAAGETLLREPRKPVGLTPPKTEVEHYQIVRADRKVYRLAHRDIQFVESRREYVVYHTNHGKTMALGSLKQLEQDLPDNFMRVHKSYIVAKNRIRHLEGNRLMVGTTEVPVGASYRASVMEQLFRG